jgi:8-oxo-dGTP pyrophosphatase MutT (NUDIX family)
MESEEQITTPIDAATIVLLRDGADGLETYMTVRAATMDFQPNALVFPGGKVSPGDMEILSDDLLGQFKAAAIRETFEEVGVLLAKRDGQYLAEQDVADLSAWRKQLVTHTANMDEFAAGSDLALDFEALHLISRWVTPNAMPKRFDTYFFLAEFPKNQVPAPDNYEAVQAGWFTPSEALAKSARGEYLLVPPTYWTLKDLLEYNSVSEAISGLARDSVQPVEPVIVKRDGKTIIKVPGRNGS